MTGTSAEVDVRPMRPEDVEAAQAVGHESIDAGLARYELGYQRIPNDAARLERGLGRMRHLLATDPGGAWVAAAGDEVVGVALALVRDSMWFLSLFGVAESVQASGLGRRLLDATLGYGSDTQGAWICATPDPKALRRYAAAGFALQPGYRAHGQVDRALLPAGLRVRDGDLARDADLVENVTTALRGAPHGPDLERMVGSGNRLLVADAGGYAVLQADGVSVLGARDPEVAAELLWAGLAETSEPTGVLWLTAAQGWAIDVALAARLSLLPGPSICTRGELGPLTPYLPSGAYG